MLDEYSLRLLAEIGVDVYLPRTAAPEAGHVVAPADMPRAQIVPDAKRVDRPIEVGIVSASSQRTKLLAHVGIALRFARIRSAVTDVDAVDTIASMHGVVVLGETLARTLGAQLPAQRQDGIEWVVAGEPDALACSAIAKRALWGEIKRLSRAFAPPANDGGARR